MLDEREVQIDKRFFSDDNYVIKDEIDEIYLDRSHCLYKTETQSESSFILCSSLDWCSSVNSTLTQSGTGSDSYEIL